jgi:dTMP kinase
MDIALLRQLNDLATGSLVPDLTVLIDIEPNTGLSRIANKDRLDSEPLDFHRKVREGFLQEARLFAGRFRILDGTRPPDVISRQAAEMILDALRRRQQS